MWPINEHITTQSSNQEQRSTMTLGREETRSAGSGAFPTLPVSQTPVYVASAIAGLHIEPSRFRPRPGLVPSAVSSHVKSPQTITTNGARRRTQLPVDGNQERIQGRLASNIEYRNTPHRRKAVPLPSRLDESSSSESECSVGHPPASSSRLRVDFRDMSPESSETSPDRDTSRRGRRALEEGHR